MVAFYIVLAILTYIPIYQNRVDEKYVKRYIVINTAILVLLAGLRSVKVGPDTLNYLRAYKELVTIPLDILWAQYKAGELKDAWFWILAKIFSMLGISPRLWLFGTSLLSVGIVGRHIYKYSKNACLSFISFISLTYFYFFMAGIRQSIAMAILFLAYPALRDRKPIRFLIVVFVASLFHSSAWLFVLAYPVAYIKVGFKHIFGVGVVLLFANFFKTSVANVLNFFFVEESRYVGYANAMLEGKSGLSWAGFIIQLFVFLFCLIILPTAEKGDDMQQKETMIHFNMSFLGLVFQAFAVVIPEMFRASYFFSIYNIILIANTIDMQKTVRAKELYIFGPLVALISYYFYGGYIEYTFFWQIPNSL